jgi:predicted protein tyrosine phosphatase
LTCGGEVLTCSQPPNEDRLSSSLPFQITICGMGDLSGYSRSNVSHVLSFLDPGSPAPPDFDAFGGHERLELRFHDIIDEYPDLLCPRREHIEQLLEFVREAGEQPTQMHMLVHCHAGFSRSPASAILALAALRPKLPATEIVEELLRLRRHVWPNLRMIELGDELLGRAGELIRAVHRLHALLLRRDPTLKTLIRDVGRGREVEAAIAAGKQNCPRVAAINQPPGSAFPQGG